jgi:hypothetical protein
MPPVRWVCGDAGRATAPHVEEYERMTQVGILRKDDRVELLEGEIVEMAPIGPPPCHKPAAILG